MSDRVVHGALAGCSRASCAIAHGGGGMQGGIAIRYGDMVGCTLPVSHIEPMGRGMM